MAKNIGNLVAHEVNYRLPGESGSTVVIFEEGTSLEQAVAEKLGKKQDRFYRIEDWREVPISSIQMSDLTVGEFCLIMKALQD